MQVLASAAKHAVDIVVISGRIDSENQLFTRDAVVALSKSHTESIAWLEQRLNEDKASMVELMRLHHLEIDQHFDRHFQSQNAQLDRIESGLSHLIGDRRGNQPRKASAIKCFVCRLLWARRVIVAFQGKKYMQYDRLKLLSWLSTIPYVQHHRQIIDEVQKGTGIWFLHDPDYRDWRDSRESSLLWLHGPAGTGKSSLT